MMLRRIRLLSPVRKIWRAGNVYSEEDELKVTVGSKSWDSHDYKDTVIYNPRSGSYRFEEVELKVKAQE